MESLPKFISFVFTLFLFFQKAPPLYAHTHRHIVLVFLAFKLFTSEIFFQSVRYCLLSVCMYKTTRMTVSIIEFQKH